MSVRELMPSELDYLLLQRGEEGWRWSEPTQRDDGITVRMFMPPEGDERINWCAEWIKIPTATEDHYYVPHWVTRED